MRREMAFSVFVFIFVAVLMAGESTVKGQAPAAKAMNKDEVFFSIAGRIHTVSESPVSALVSEIDGVIEITGITTETDGKALVTVKERTASSAPKSIRLKFAPPANGQKWVWTEFEENRRFYPVERLFPYTKDELGKRNQLAASKWGAVVASIDKQAESAAKVLDTAKAVLKTDPPMLVAFTNSRNALKQAIKDNDKDGIVNAYRELSGHTEPILSLADTYNDLKANDAYLRLLEEYKNWIKVSNTARKEYVQSVDAYNETLLRLPFALVAYGLQFTKLEASITEGIARMTISEVTSIDTMTASDKAIENLFFILYSSLNKNLIDDFGRVRVKIYPHIRDGHLLGLNVSHGKRQNKSKRKAASTGSVSSPGMLRRHNKTSTCA